MKIVFSFLLFLAVSALSADIVLKFADSSEMAACEKSADADADDPIQDSDDDEDGEEREFKLFFGHLATPDFALQPAVMTAMNTHIAFFIEHPLQSPPFSPPELA